MGRALWDKWDSSVSRALWDSGIAQWVEHCEIVG